MRALEHLDVGQLRGDNHQPYQAAKGMVKIGFLVLKNMFKGQQMKIEGLLDAIAH